MVNFQKAMDGLHHSNPPASTFVGIIHDQEKDLIFQELVQNK